MSSTDQEAKIYSLKSSKSEVLISSLAGFSISWTVGPNKTQILGNWQGSDGNLTSGFPMFPVIGRIGEDGVISDEKGDFTPGKHGFCRNAPFKPKEVSKNEVSFSLRHDPSTTPFIYPYASEIELSYHLAETELTIQTIVRNLGKNLMAFGCGLHPAFAIPVDGSLLSLTKALPEKTTVYRPIQGSLRDGITASNPFQNLMWKLTPSTFKDDAFFFVLPNPGTLSFVLQSSNGRKLSIALDGWNGFGVWSKPDKPDFICIEPITGAALAPLPAPRPYWDDVKGLARLEPMQSFRATTKIKVLKI